MGRGLVLLVVLMVYLAPGVKGTFHLSFSTEMVIMRFAFCTFLYSNCIDFKRIKLKYVFNNCFKILTAAMRTCLKNWHFLPHSVCLLLSSNSLAWVSYFYLYSSSGYISCIAQEKSPDLNMGKDPKTSPWCSSGVFFISLKKTWNSSFHRLSSTPDHTSPDCQVALVLLMVLSQKSCHSVNLPAETCTSWSVEFTRLNFSPQTNCRITQNAFSKSLLVSLQNILMTLLEVRS